jgi:chemotaxis protein CheD
MNRLTVGVGDCAVTADPDAELITYAIGSCIALAIWDPRARVGGLLHFMLPESSLEPAPQRSVAQPFRYADTGIPLLFRSAYALGAEKKRLQVQAAGAATVIEDGGIFNIGKRNYAAMRKILWRAGVLMHAEAIGGTQSRTVRLDVGTGAFWVRGPKEAERKLEPARERGAACLAAF